MISDMILFYLDPGTGALIFQIIAGGIITTLVFFKSTVVRIFRFFFKKKE